MKNEDIKKTIANNIRFYREKANLTMEELAQKLDTTKSNVSGWENMKYIPNITTLFRLCDIFDITVNQMYGLEDQTVGQNEVLPLIQEFLIKLGIKETQIDKLNDEQINALKIIIKNFLDKQSDN